MTTSPAVRVWSDALEAMQGACDNNIYVNSAHECLAGSDDMSLNSETLGPIRQPPELCIRHHGTQLITRTSVCGQRKQCNTTLM